MNLADMVGNVVRALQCGELAQILADGIAIAADAAVERMPAGDQHDAAFVNGVGRTVIRGQKAGIRADGDGFVHAAIGRGNAVGIPVIRDGLVSADVAVAGVGCQLAADAAGCDAHEVVICRRAVDNLTGVKTFCLMYFFHEGLPQRRGGVAARCLGSQRLVIVVANPHGAGVPACHAGEEYALAVGVGACLAGDNLRRNLRLCAGAALHSLLEHVHDQIGGRGLEDLMAVLLLAHVHNDVAVAVKDS